MSVLILRLAGPLQAWGSDSRFAYRSTRAAPTKSGVIGLLAAAKGMRRTDAIEDLLALRFGVRVDQPGRLIRDFHTAHGAGGSMPLSYRFYLSDALFVAGVEGEADLISSLDSALRNPTFPLYLGRRSCPPVGPVTLGIRDSGLVEALQAEPWHAAEWWKRRSRGNAVTLELLVDGQGSADSERELREAFVDRDQPISFDPQLRQYTWRSVQRGWVEVEGSTGNANAPAPDTGDVHDPMSVFGV